MDDNEKTFSDSRFIFDSVRLGAALLRSAKLSAIILAKNSFDQSKAICRDANLQHNWMGDTYDLETPKYKACMEKEGYHFQGQQ